MEDIDFELCLTVEKHAAIIRRQKRKTPTPKVNNSNRTADGDADENADGTGACVPAEVRGHEHGGDTHVDTGRETGGNSGPSLKRAKISASGSWCAGSTGAHNAHQQGTVEGTASATTSFPSSGMVDTTPGPIDRINRDMPPPPPPYLPLLSSAQASATAPFIMPSLLKPKPKPRIDPITNEHLNDSTSFTIYEDSIDRDTQDFKPDFGMGFNGLEFNMHHGLGFNLPDPEPWYSRLEDNKENTEDGLYDNYEYDIDAGIDDEGGGIDALLWGGGSGVDGGMNWELNDRDIGMTTAGGFEGMRHHAPGPRDLSDMRRLYHNPTVEGAGFLDAGAAMDVDMMNMEIRPADDNGGERGPQMHAQVENGGNQQLQDISIMGVPTAGGNWASAGQISPSLLGAPPRRFLGRGGASRR